jgi:sugar (pentulose or hexulose) kinase
MSSPRELVLIGIDVGTSGVRSIAVTRNGDVLAEARAPLAELPASGAAHEQDPATWWNGVCLTLHALRQDIRLAGASNEIAGLSVTSTSGSLVLVDQDGNPVRPAMLYDDGRASGVAEDLNHRLAGGESAVNASFSLAKAMWVRQFEAPVWKRAKRILHPADWLASKFTGEFGISDYSNALKLGYDREKSGWISAVGMAEMPASMLPRIVAPGDLLGKVSPKAADESGLAVGVPVYAGASDGLASLVGSGANMPGDANTTLGTTLVWKVLAVSAPRLGPGMYCHHLPGNLCVPGAASNTGPGSLRLDPPFNGLKNCGNSKSYATRSPDEMSRDSARFLPTRAHCYLLASRGERFPAAGSDAKAFFEGAVQSPEEAYAAQLQSLACVERWGYERLEASGVPVGGEIYSAGSAAANPVLSQLRANVLGRQILRTTHPSASLGAAILAASSAFFDRKLARAMAAMNRVAESFHPEPKSVGRFSEAYEAFRQACSRHGLT